MWSAALRVGGCGRGVGWFVVLWRPVCGTASVIRASQVAPLRLWRLNVVLCRLVCGVARGGAIYDARCRNGTCGRSRCVSVDAGGATVDCCFASVIRASQVAPLRLRAVECGFASVIWASQVVPLRLRAVECCFASVIRASRVAPLRLRVVECCFAAVIRASQVAPLRLRAVECCFASVIRVSRVAPLRLRVVECCFAGGCWRRNGGCRRKGMGMKKRSRTDVAVSVWLLVVAEARLERTTSRL